MHSRPVAVYASLTLAIALSGCGTTEQVVSTKTTSTAGPTADSAASSGDASSETASSSSTSDASPAGGDATPVDLGDRHEFLTDEGGVVVEGSEVTFVYNTGVRKTFDMGGAVPVDDSGNATMATASGDLLVLSSGAGSMTSAAGGVSTVDSHGAGSIVEGDGVIDIGADGSMSCVGPAGVQVLASDGAAAEVGNFGVIVQDAKGKQVVVGDPGANAKPVGRYAGCDVEDTATIELAGDVLFDFDKDTLSSAGQEIIAQTVDMLEQHAAGKALTVTGHTDAKGSESYNLDLSERRARTVESALAKKLQGQTITAEGAGEAEPVAPNTTSTGDDNPEGRAANRRVTITFTR